MAPSLVGCGGGRPAGLGRARGVGLGAAESRHKEVYREGWVFWRGRFGFFCALGRRMGRRLRRRVAGGMDEGLVVAAGCDERLRGAWG